MPARKYSASMDEELLDEVEQAAREAGMTVSAWLAQAAKDRLDLLGLEQLVDEWEADHGAFTEEELAEAERRLNEPEDPADILAEAAEEAGVVARSRRHTA